MIDFKALGNRIKYRRLALSMTQERLAETVDIATEHLSRIETGASRPSLGLIERIAGVLGTDESDLLFGSAVEKAENLDLLQTITGMDPAKRGVAKKIIEFDEKRLKNALSPNCPHLSPKIKAK